MKPTLTSYILGFIFSVALTLTAFYLVLNPGFFHLGLKGLMASILILAIIQLIVQLVFFLHLADETGPRWKFVAFIATIGIILVIVIGSIWIMNNLNYNMMASPSQMNAYIQSQDGF
jgi:cytochrome o ubiquinol oxidase operon protein cyoD